MNASNSLIAQGNSLLRQGEWSLALSLFKEWQRIHPEIAHICQLNIRIAEARLTSRRIIKAFQPKAPLFDGIASHSRLYSLLDILISGLERSYTTITQLCSSLEKPGDYQEFIYLLFNPDVRDAVKNGDFRDGHHHFSLFAKGSERLSSYSDILLLLKDTINCVKSCKSLRPSYLFTLGSSSAFKLLGRLRRILSILSKPSSVLGLSSRTIPEDLLNYLATPAIISAISDLIQTQRDSLSECISEILSIHPYYEHEKPIFSKPKSQWILDIYPSLKESPFSINLTNCRIAVHIHIFYPEVLPVILKSLANIPLEFDLFATCPHELENSVLPSLENLIAESGAFVNSLICVPVENRGRDMMPLSSVLAHELQEYTYVLHLHTKKSTHSSGLSNWLDDILNCLLHSKQGVLQLLEALQYKCDLIIPQEQRYYPPDPSGWADNRDKAMDLLQPNIIQYDAPLDFVIFPEGGMFWARGELMHKLSKLEVSALQYEPEPILQDGSTAHAVERIIGTLAMDSGKRIGRACIKSPFFGDPQYQEKHNYAYKPNYGQRSRKPRIFAYFLPQFEPNLYNNIWHGNNFTEWSKVADAQPLYPTHYQQRFPHDDIGYYLLDNQDELKRIESQLNNSLIDGLIIYHYWFSGNLILESFSQLLLRSTDINIPFYFCWANENWTKQWDGNNSEILMAQKYSANDARLFIEYLIDFIADPRYIKVNGRPVIQVYRPAHNPMMEKYIEIWRHTCKQRGLPNPYIVATLGRDSLDFKQTGFDACCERVLHDWLGGKGEEMAPIYAPPSDFSGSILRYEDVFAYYKKIQYNLGIPCIRSIVPSWDNTPRYNKRAHIIHGSTPSIFHDWMSHLLRDTQSLEDSNNSLSEESIVVVNAWNEWAESAYLEPDTRFGYSYLNSVARAKLGLSYNLSKHEFRELITPARQVSSVFIEVPAFIARSLRESSCNSAKFWRCLSSCSSSITLYVSQDILEIIPLQMRGRFLLFKESEIQDYVIMTCRRLALAPFDMIPKALEFQSYYQDYHLAVQELNTKCSQISSIGEYGMPMESLVSHFSFSFRHSNSRELRGCKLIPDTYSFHMDPDMSLLGVHEASYAGKSSGNMHLVDIVVRYHESACMAKLFRALISLYGVQGNLDVRPIIACQDLTHSTLTSLNQYLQILAWPGRAPEIIKYFSTKSEPDCRARMLTETLKSVEADYVGFLDYDDYIYPWSYKIMIERMIHTGSTASFGRCHTTHCSSERGIELQKHRSMHEGNSFVDFMKSNFIPIHSFLLACHAVNPSDLKYVPGMRYLEDYYLLLQVLKRDDADWESLQLNMYVASYSYDIDSSSTLSQASSDAIQAIVESDEYMQCQTAVDQLKELLLLA